MAPRSAHGRWCGDLGAARCAAPVSLHAAHALYPLGHSGTTRSVHGQATATTTAKPWRTGGDLAAAACAWDDGRSYRIGDKRKNRADVSGRERRRAQLLPRLRPTEPLRPLPLRSRNQAGQRGAAATRRALDLATAATVRTVHAPRDIRAALASIPAGILAPSRFHARCFDALTPAMVRLAGRCQRALSRFPRFRQPRMGQLSQRPRLLDVGAIVRCLLFDHALGVGYVVLARAMVPPPWFYLSWSSRNSFFCLSFLASLARSPSSSSLL